MKSLPNGNIFSKYYLAIGKNTNNNNKSNNFNFNPTFEQMNQNASIAIGMSYPNSKKIMKRNKRTSKMASKKLSVSNKFQTSLMKKIRLDTVKDESTFEPCIEQNGNASCKNVILKLVNFKYDKPSLAKDFCELFEFYPTLIPSENYQEYITSACNDFYQYYINTVDQIINFVKEQNIFKVRELMRFHNQLKLSVVDSFQPLIVFFMKTPFSCGKGTRFSSIRPLFEHNGCINCNSNEKPKHLCQCGIAFDSHEDWVQHVFPRKGIACIVSMFSLFTMHDENTEINPIEKCKIFFCSGCQRKTTNFVDLYYHMIFCPLLEQKLLKNCVFCNRKTRQIYESSHCHHIRSANSVYSQPKQPNSSNYVKMLGKYFQIIPPSMLTKLRS